MLVWQYFHKTRSHPFNLINCASDVLAQGWVEVGMCIWWCMLVYQLVHVVASSGIHVDVT